LLVVRILLEYKNKIILIKTTSMQHFILTVILLFSSAVLVQAQENKEEVTITVTVINALNDCTFLK
jgi:hypothetical protein